MLIFGAHMSIDKGFAAAAQKAVEQYRANAMQIFTKNPRGRGSRPVSPADLEKYLEYKPRLKFMIAHSSYLLNFGKPIEQIPWAENDLLQDFERLALLKGDGVIVHVGKALDGNRPAAFKNVIENAKLIIDKSKHTNLTYILENTAGQGNEIGYKFGHLQKIHKAMKTEGPRFKFCLDTAHMWAAGYDFSTEKSTIAMLKEFDEIIGIKNIACFHFNDSKKECGSRVDRHDNLGNGQIPSEGMKTILQFAEKKSIPVILETPDKNPGDRMGDLEILNEMMAG